MSAERDSRFELAHAIGSEYEILEELGRGGSSVVYHARDLVLGREVAIKVIRSSQLDDAEAVTRFEREARVLARLQHPNIVMLYAAKQLSAGSLALVMQHSSSWRTLKSLVRENGPFSSEAAEQVIIDLAAALEYLHAHQVVHRDIKPENIFVETDTGHALLADFGIAKPGDAQSSVTLTGVVIGTPAYMSPEQIDGVEVTGQSDIYSLGMVGYEMLTGRRPWAGESLYSVIFRQKTERLPPMAELRPDVSQRLCEAIEKATEKEPRDRWADAGELLVHLGARPSIYPSTAVEVVRQPVPVPQTEVEESPTIDIAGLLANAGISESEVQPARPAWLVGNSKRVGMAATVMVLLGAGAAAVAMTRPTAAVPTTDFGSIALSTELDDPTAFSSAERPLPLDSVSVAADEAREEAPPAAGTAASNAPAADPSAPAPTPRRTLPAPPVAPVVSNSTLVAAISAVPADPAVVAPVEAVAAPTPPRLPVAMGRGESARDLADADRRETPRLLNAGAFAEQLQRMYAATPRLPGGSERLNIVLAVLVDERGEVVETEVRTSSGVDYVDEAARAATRLMRFSAASDSSVPSRIWVTVPLTLER